MIVIILDFQEILIGCNESKVPVKIFFEIEKKLRIIPLRKKINLASADVTFINRSSLLEIRSLTRKSLAL